MSTLTKKAQLSIETMIIYGLVILVTLSVIGGLLYFNILDVGSYLPEQCDLSSNDLNCDEYVLSGTSNTFDLGIRNTGQRAITIDTITVTDASGIFFDEVEGDMLDDADNVVTGIGPGQVRAVVFDVSEEDIPEGQTLRGAITIRYKYADGVVDQEARGSLRLNS